jgi:hypothetical protein
VGKAAAYTVLVDGWSCAVGDGPAFKAPKGSYSPRNEYEELCLQVGVEAGAVKPPATAEED